MTEEEIQRAVEMMRTGYGLARIALELNKNKRIVQHHIRQRTMSKEERAIYNAKRADADRERRAARGGRKPFVANDGIGTAGNVGSVKPSQELLADRDRRRSRPFTIANDILGDPEPGRSALDQRMNGAMA